MLSDPQIAICATIWETNVQIVLFEISMPCTSFDCLKLTAQNLEKHYN